MNKVTPHLSYPCEEGRYVRGNDFSPVAVAIVLNTDEDKIPKEIELLVRTGVESGAALSGTVQTPNIGLEKIVCNIIANTNIRFLILGGPESEGHHTGDAIKCLMANGVDEKKHIIDTTAPFATLYNISNEMIDRFRDQVTLVDCQFQGDPSIIRKAVWSCFQENPVDFNGMILCDPGAYPELPMEGSITWKVTQPWWEPEDDKERKAVEKAKAMIEMLKSRKP